MVTDWVGALDSADSPFKVGGSGEGVGSIEVGVADRGGTTASVDGTFFTVP